VVVKCGTSVITQPNGHPSLTRIGAICEQVSELVARGRQVVLVSSGAVGYGRKLMRNQALLAGSVRDQMMSPGGSPGDPNSSNSSSSPGKSGRAAEYSAACAAAGQFGLMNIYSTMFEQVDMKASQLLLTQADFQSPSRLSNLQSCVDQLLAMGVIPIINENDAVSANQGYTSESMFSDNDSLASLCARSFRADALLLLTDVEGVYVAERSEVWARAKVWAESVRSVAGSSKDQAERETRASEGPGRARDHGKRGTRASFARRLLRAATSPLPPRSNSPLRARPLAQVRPPALRAQRQAAPVLLRLRGRGRDPQEQQPRDSHRREVRPGARRDAGEAGAR
jgi:glutamate 5-kinase